MVRQGCLFSTLAAAWVDAMMLGSGQMPTTHNWTSHPWFFPAHSFNDIHRVTWGR